VGNACMFRSETSEIRINGTMSHVLCFLWGSAQRYLRVYRSGGTCFVERKLLKRWHRPTSQVLCPLLRVTCIYITLIHAHAHTSDTPPHTAICHTRTHAAGRLLLSSAALVAPHALGASSPFICSSMRNMATFQVPRRAKLGIKPL
jgi:hypothetical protein